MRIIILGAGKVGMALTQQLEQEDHDVVIIDLNADKVEEAVNLYDVIGVVGNAASYDVLTQADVEEAEVVITVTETDELNILAGLMAKQMGAKNCIARVRNPEYLKQRVFMKEKLGLSMIINPELEGANEIRRILMFPSAVKVDTFVGGKIELVKFRLHEKAKIEGIPLNHLNRISKAKVLICVVRRGEETIIPDGNFILQKNDHIYVIGEHRNLARFCQDVGLFEQKIRRVIIVGGSSTAVYLAQQLYQQGIQVKIIEIDAKRCLEISRRLPNVTVIEADGSDEEVLIEEGIEGIDAFITLTGLDEENIMIALYAKEMKAKKTVAKVTRMNFLNVLNNLEIDSVISPKSIITSHILRYVRAKANKDDETSMKKLYQMIEDEAEAIEFAVTANTSLVDQKIADLRLKNNILIAAVSREKGFIIPNSETVFRLDDRVIIITKAQKISNLNDIIRR